MSYRAIIQKSYTLQFTETKAEWAIIAKNKIYQKCYMVAFLKEGKNIHFKHSLMYWSTTVY